MNPKTQIVFQVARDAHKNYALAVNGVVLGGKPLGYLDGRVIGTYTVTVEEIERALGARLVTDKVIEDHISLFDKMSGFIAKIAQAEGWDRDHALAQVVACDNDGADFWNGATGE